MSKQIFLDRSQQAEARTFLELYRKMDEEQKRRVIEYINTLLEKEK